MAKQTLDLYELYKLVVERGGLLEVINKKLWQEIIKGLHLPQSITSAAFTLRTQYRRYLYPIECEKRGFSTPEELQAVIDGNRREGRSTSVENTIPSRNNINSLSNLNSSFGNGLNMSSSSVFGGIDQTMSSLASLLSQQQNSQQDLQQRLLAATSFGYMNSNTNVSPEMEMIMQYMKMIESQKALAQGSDNDPSNVDMQRLAWMSMYNKNNGLGGLGNLSPILHKQESDINSFKRTTSEYDEDEYSSEPKRFQSEDHFEDEEEDEEEPVSVVPEVVYNSTENEIENPNTPVSLNHIEPQAKKEEVSLMGGMAFNIVKVENGEVTIKMTLNGIDFEGVLKANMSNTPKIEQISALETPEKSVDEDMHKDTFKPIKLTSFQNFNTLREQSFTS